MICQKPVLMLSIARSSPRKIVGDLPATDNSTPKDSTGRAGGRAPNGFITGERLGCITTSLTMTSWFLEK